MAWPDAVRMQDDGPNVLAARKVPVGHIEHLPAYQGTCPRHSRPGRHPSPCSHCPHLPPAQVMDALNMEFEDNTFDLVWACESGEHMPDKKK